MKNFEQNITEIRKMINVIIKKSKYKKKTQRLLLFFFFFFEFFPSADRFSLEFEWQQDSSSSHDSSQYNGLSQ